MSYPVVAPAINEYLAGLPDHAVVCEVGGGSSRRTRADWVIDLVRFEDRESIKPEDRVTADRWIVHDICSPGPWPVANDAFDYTVCSHVLEDVRDPFKVAGELMRISRAGYLQMPGRVYESARSPYGLVPGSLHHRWLVEKTKDGELIFTAKSGHLVEFASLQVHRRVSLYQGLIELYWNRDALPIRVREVTPDVEDFISFRARAEGIPEGRVRRQYEREFLRKRVAFKLLRTLRRR